MKEKSLLELLTEFMKLKGVSLTDGDVRLLDDILKLAENDGYRAAIGLEKI